MNCYSTGAGSHSTLVSSLASLNLDAFHPTRSGYPFAQYANRDATCLYQRPQYLSNVYHHHWMGPAFQPKAPTSLANYSYSWNWPWTPAMNPYTGSLPQLTYNPFAIPQFNMADMEYPSSPTGTSASECSPCPTPQRIPLLAPKPLPYHSPKFLQFDLPDDDEDLSHPPYLRPTKRKRDDEEEEEENRPEEGPIKRRASEDAFTASMLSRRGVSGQLAPRRQSLSNLATCTRRRR